MSYSDPDLLVMFLSILIILASLAFVFVLMFWTRRRHLRAWEEFATGVGLLLEPGSLFGSARVTGSYRGHSVVLDSFMRHYGKTSTNYTRITVWLNRPATLTLTLYNENVFGKLGKALGGQDIEIGDMELDRRFILKGQPEHAIRAMIMTGGLSHYLQQAGSLHIEVNGSQARVHKMGLELNLERLRALLDLMVAVAGSAERVSDSPLPVPSTSWAR